MGHPHHKYTPRTPSYVLPVVIGLSLFSFTALLLHKVDNFVSQTPTVVGHNLDPTPWHDFPRKSFDDETRHGRAYKIIHCSYLTCRYRSEDNVQKERRRFPTSTRSSPKCPDFFAAIHRDLQPWAASKITIAHVMETQKYAAFRVIIVGGKLFVDLYYACVQSRAMFTIWSFLQLLRRYPGMVPDVDIMFDCMDKPTINRTEHQGMPLPLFRYCTTNEHFDIPFPDWSFWGWSEINVRPWHQEFPDIKLGSQTLTWDKKSPFAYWKGNPDVASPIRLQLLNCNDTALWGALIMRQDWKAAAKTGFKGSKLSNQCNHQYKIYAEGYAWSVSLKYILSCGSVALIISPQYQDFFSRGLIPQNNYWLIDALDLCPSIKRAVDWGNEHPVEISEHQWVSTHEDEVQRELHDAQVVVLYLGSHDGIDELAEAIGKRGQELMESLSMDRIYDYMYHLLSEYAKLQDFKPTPPSSALEVCAESVLCYANEKQTPFLKESTAVPSPSPPCTLPPPNPDHP